jgi:hypothetical protein
LKIEKEGKQKNLMCYLARCMSKLRAKYLSSGNPGAAECYTTAENRQSQPHK